VVPVREPVVPSAEPSAHKAASNRREETERDNVALSKDEAITVRGRKTVSNDAVREQAGAIRLRYLNCC